MYVVNLFGPPGVGKSVISAAIYADLAKNNLNVELCREYTKTASLSTTNTRKYRLVIIKSYSRFQPL